jgi:ubiquinone biosynthesis protein UbiJ
MNSFFLSSLSKTMNAYLALDPESSERAKKLSHHRLAIELLPFHFTFICYFDEQGVHLTTDHTIQPDVTLRGTPLQLLGATLAKDNRHIFFSDDLVIEGNAEIAQQVTALFDRMQIDWEEHLANLTGDHIAYRIGRLSEGAFAWLRQTNDSLTASVSDYLHEEAQWFPAREALNDFFTEIDTLRMDVDRLEAKMLLLRSSLQDEEVNK